MPTYDKSSKWLIQHFGDAILKLAGVRDLVSWRPLQAEVVQPRQLPDGLVEATRAGSDRPELFVLELATYPEPRLLEQVVRDLTLVYLDRRELPEALALILHPRGAYRVPDRVEVRSPRGWSSWEIRFKVVELWTIPAEDLLGAGDLGVIPWVPLSKIDGPPEPILRACAERIEAEAPPDLRENLLAVTHVFTALRYNDRRLLELFLGGRATMLKLPIIDELLAERRHNDIVRFLVARFGPSAREILPVLKPVEEDDQLDELIDLGAACPDLASFRRRLDEIVAALPTAPDEPVEAAPN